MSVRTDVVNLSVNITGNKAQNELNELRKKAADIRFEMQGLTKGTQDYIAKAKELKGVNDQMDALKKTIGLNSLTLKELNAEMRKLQALKGFAIPFSKDFNDLEKQIQAVSNRIYDVKNGVTGFSSFMSKIKDEVKQFGIVAASYLGFQFITSQFQNIIRGAGKISDQLADLQRVAGLTADEAKNLNKQLSAIDTRTSADGLRQIAIVAGKLGVAKEDILGFTQAVDQLVVSLGDELGNADQITESLGKILNVFEGKITGDNISRLGNAFVELANAGVATGGFIADFDQRLSGIAKSAGIGLGELSGLGAGLEELGARVESSATAIQKLVVSISEDIPGAAKIAGLSAEEFQKLFATNATEALLKYSEGLVKNKESFSEVTASLKNAGEEGARTIETISKLGTSSDLLRTKIQLGAKAFQETGAITEAFNLKNETFGSTLDKLGKEFNKLVTSPGLQNFLKGATENVLEFIKALQKAPQFIKENSTAITLIGVGIATMNAAYIKSGVIIVRDTALKLLNATATKSTAIATAIAETAQASYIVVTQLLTRQISIATAAQRLWNIAMSLGAGPIGIIISLVGVAAIAFGNMSKSISKAAIEQRAMLKVQEMASDAYGDQINKLERLRAGLMSSNTDLATKKEYYRQLIEIHPEFAKTLSLDEQGHLKGADAIKAYILQLQKKGEAEAAQSLSSEKFKEILDVQRKLQSLQGSTDPGYFSPALKKSLNDKLTALQTEKKYYDDIIGSSVAASVKQQQASSAAAAAAGKTAQSSIGLIKDLQEKIKKLDDARPDLTTRNAISQNIKERERLQKLLDNLEGRSTKQSKDESEFQRLKQDYEKFYRDLKGIKERAEAGQNPEQEEILRANQKFEELLRRNKEYWAKHVIDNETAHANDKLITEAQQAEINAIYKKYLDKRLADQAGNEYEQALNDRAEFSNKLKAAAAKDYADNKITKQQYEEQIKQIDRDETSDRIIIAQDYAATVKKAADDLVKFRKDKEKQTTADLIAETDKRKAAELADKDAGLQRAILVAKKGSAERLAAEKEYLNFKREQEFIELEQTEVTQNKIALINQKYRDQEAELEKQYALQKIDNWMTYIDFIGQALSSVNTIISNSENAQLAREKAANDKRRKEYKKQLDDKLISQGQYDKKLAELQEKEDARNKQIKQRQAKREKALNLFNAIVNTAAAIVKALVDPGGIAGVGLSIAAGITGALQVAAIASAPLPEFGSGAWVRQGDKHSDPSGGIPAKIERDEAVMSASAMTDKKVRTVTGTTAQITSYLNGQAGGVTWSAGALSQTTPWVWQPSTPISSEMPRIMARGGLGGIDVSGSVSPWDTRQAVNRSGGANVMAGAEPWDTRQAVNRSSGSGISVDQLAAAVISLTEEVKNWPRTVKGEWYYKDLKENEDLYNKAKQASGLNQQ